MADTEYDEIGDKSPGGRDSRSLESHALTIKQYFLVNLSRCLIELGGTAVLALVLHTMQGKLEYVLLSLWVLTLFFIDISGAHFNPCITLVVMMRKNTSFGKRRLKGLLYMFSQFLGSVLGTFLATYLLSPNTNHIQKTPYGAPESPHTFQSIISEIIGTFVFCLFFMISTDKKTQYSDQKALNCLVIASSYVGSTMLAGGACVTLKEPILNPFIAFGLCLWSGVWTYPQYIFAPLGGAILSLVFYEMVFVKTLEYLEDDNEEEEEENAALDI